MNSEFKQTRQGYVDALLELAPKLPELLVLDADVAKATKTCDFQKKFPDRHINCGTAEQNELSVAAGLAIEGFLPSRPPSPSLSPAARAISCAPPSATRRPT
jgi:transketolase